MKFNVVSANSVIAGTSVSMKYFFQFGQSSSQSATVRVYLDTDANPYDGGSTQIFQSTESGTGPNTVTWRQFSYTATMSPGQYNVYAKITDGTHTRYLQAPENLTITATTRVVSLSGNMSFGNVTVGSS